MITGLDTSLRLCCDSFKQGFDSMSGFVSLLFFSFKI